MAHYFGSAPGIEIKKYVSHTAAGPWDDAESETGPYYQVGSDVYFRFVVTNTGNVLLTDVTAGDTDFDLSGWTIPDLAPSGEAGDSAEYILGPVSAGAGQHSNTADVAGTPPVGAAVTDDDMAHYFGSDADVADIALEKNVWGGTNWQDADAPSGPHLPATMDPVIFRFLITNTGTLTLNVTLTDTHMTEFYTDFDRTTLATFPIEMLDGESETLFGSLPWMEGQHSNNATATGVPEVGDPVFDSDPCHYFGISITVGWETHPTNKAAVLAPWIALLATFMAGAALLLARRRRALM